MIKILMLSLIVGIIVLIPSYKLMNKYITTDRVVISFIFFMMFLASTVFTAFNILNILNYLFTGEVALWT